MKTLIGIEIPRRSKNCLKCEIPFAKGQDYYSVLDQNKNYREDFCIQCWKEVNSSLDQKSYWKSKVPLAKEGDVKAHLTFSERIINLFKLSMQENDNLDEIFILSLYLIRKKLAYLKEEVVDEDGHKYNLIELQNSEEIYAVQKRDLTQIPVEKIQAEIAQKIQ